MSMPVEGSRVSYIGEHADIEVGDRGKVLAGAGPSASHVRWDTGKKAGTITMEAHYDLVVEREPHVPDGGLVTTVVAKAYERDGTVGMLNALSTEGHLASFPTIAEEAARLVNARIREDPIIQRAIAHLDPEEATELVSLATVSLLRDAFGD